MNRTILFFPLIFVILIQGYTVDDEDEDGVNVGLVHHAIKIFSEYYDSFQDQLQKNLAESILALGDENSP